MTWWNALDQPLPSMRKWRRSCIVTRLLLRLIWTASRKPDSVCRFTSVINSLEFCPFIWSACNVTLTRLIMNLRRVAADAEESLFEDPYIDSPRGWPLLPRQGSSLSENYELQGKGPDVEICDRLSPSVASTTM
ncbi:hypothetical protein EDB19DRAFT_1905177 [Suillus lakei]|nr:hypothetical protein EDB19DRAFT_1905177 [Suillus lakei]